MKTRIALFMLCLMGFPAALLAQHTLKTKVLSDKAEPLAYATVALLLPSDSTMAFFGISNAEGDVEIRSIKAGTYLLQCAYMGYKPLYRNIEIPLPGEFPALVLEQDSRTLGEVEISAEKVPLMIKGDTIEYNAGAFKTQPDANVEELLKKLPGVEVDRAGNIKAQGENVQKVLVDGKEFFTNDPKIATKNLPADAIKKVQVYDKKSEQAEFTGIDDGVRDKTINLQLKDEKKNGYFGDLLAGGGTDGHYKASGKIYRFKPKTQFAMLGMANDVNEFGFSLQDYMSFKGGMRGLMDGSGQIMLSGSGMSLPVNFGQQITGLIRSGAGGLNYSYEPVKNNRLNFNYLGNAASKNLDEMSYTRNFTNNLNYETDQAVDELSRDRGHRMNFSWRNDLDSSQQFTLNGAAEFTDSRTNRRAVSSSRLENAVLNRLDNQTDDNGSAITWNGRGSYLKRFKGNWPLYKLNADISSTQSLSETTWRNLTELLASGQSIWMNQYQNNAQERLRYSGSASVTRRLGEGYYMDLDMSAGREQEDLNRKQGLAPEVENPPFLDADFSKTYQWMRPGLSIKKSTDKIKYNLGMRWEEGLLGNALRDSSGVRQQVQYLLPRFNWENDYSTGKRVGLRYETRLNAPSATQLQPIVNNTNPLQLFRGNPYLRPEYTHSLSANWMWFDQFSFTSLFMNVMGSYTHDKINYDRKINNNLGQELSFVNVPDDYRAEGSVEFSTPIRKLGIGFSIEFTESFNKGINIVNGVNNINSTQTHDISVKADNRKKEKIDAAVGAAMRYSEARYSLQSSLNNNYYNISYFCDISLTPNDKWNIVLNADINQYNSKSFKQTINIPLLKASVSRTLLKNNRGTLKLECFDLLDKNTGLQRVSELNYLRETRSNIIGRYLLLSFKYRLNKLGDGGGGKMDIRVKNR